MRDQIRNIACTACALFGLIMTEQAYAQVDVYDDPAAYDAVVGNTLLMVDFAAGTDTIVDGQSFNQLVAFSSTAPNSDFVFWSAAGGGIQNANSAAGALNVTFVGLSNALAFRFTATPMPPTVTLLDGAGAVIDSRAAGATGYYGVLSASSVETVLITPASGGSLTLEGFQANQEDPPQSDTTRPQITGITIDPATIDVTGGTQTVTVTVDVTDDLSGFGAVFVRFVSPSNQQTTNFVFANQVSGDALNQTRIAAVQFAQYIEAGDWNISLFVRDGVDNEGIVPNAALASLGLPTTLTVVSNADSDAPELLALNLSPSTVDVSGGDQTIGVSIEAQDPVAGLSMTSVTVFRARSPSGQVTQQIFGPRLVLVSGTAQSGVWEGQLPMPQFSEAGTWTVDSVSLRDAAGNSVFLNTASLNALGLTSTFQVVSSPEDLQPPQLLEFSFTPALVNTTAGAANVTVSARLTDDLSGVRQQFIDYFQPPFVQFFSPSFGQDRFAYMNLTSGTALDGVWSTDIILPQFSEQGIYTPRIRATDVVGNGFLFVVSDLQSLGFQTDLIVIRPSLFIDGVIDGDTGGTVNDTVYGVLASLSAPPGVLPPGPTEIAIDVFPNPLGIPTPVGFQVPGATLFVNIELIPEPSYPLPPPGLTVVLPLVAAGIPGTPMNLFRANPTTGMLEPSLDINGNPIVGFVDPGGLSVTFFGIRFFSVVVGLIQAAPGDLNGDTCVDRDDYSILIDAIREGAEVTPFIDLNADTILSRSDARTLVGLFTNPQGEPCASPAALSPLPVAPHPGNRPGP